MRQQGLIVEPHRERDRADARQVHESPPAVCGRVCTTQGARSDRRSRAGGKNRFSATSLLTAPDMPCTRLGVAAVAGPDAMEETSLEENHDALPSSSHLMAGQSL